jgi:hypothetical protein
VTRARSGSPSRHLFARIVKQYGRDAPDIAVLVANDMPNSLVDKPAQLVLIRIELESR